MATDTPRIPEQGVATLPDEAWERARRRAEIIGPLAQSETVGHEAADTAAQALGLSRRQVYVLIRRARQGSGLVTDLVPGQSGGGKGKGRLPEPVERIIRELLQRRFLTKQKRSLAAFHREVTQVCKAQKLRVPARNTVALRIASLDPRKVIRRREGQDAARDLQGVGGEPPAVTAPLEQVQIDHTVIDLIVVDERDRQPIGRPYLTLAIDVFTRCVLGMVVTLEAPSAVSVGLCLVHVACDKRPWLEGLNIEMEWPMSGKPRLLYLDNAAEFKSEALRRGCEQHGIRLDYRPLGQPHYGGIVERIIGTAMQMIHDELPGTTFSNPDQRGDYDSENKAALTLRELERWLTLAVGTGTAMIWFRCVRKNTAVTTPTNSARDPIVEKPLLSVIMPWLNKKTGLPLDPPKTDASITNRGVPSKSIAIGEAVVPLRATGSRFLLSHMPFGYPRKVTDSMASNCSSCSFVGSIPESMNL